MFAKRLFGLVAVLILASPVNAAEPLTGPVIGAYGPVYAVAGQTFNLEQGTHYKVSMDVSATGDFSGDLNRHLESAARFLNMHARNGIDPNDIELAVVVHGAAARDLLSDAAYETRFEEPNPNTALLAELNDAGVRIYLCGQTAAHRGFDKAELNPAVTLALSAMTAHVRLQSEGYTLIPF